MEYKLKTLLQKLLLIDLNWPVSSADKMFETKKSNMRKFFGNVLALLSILFGGGAILSAVFGEPVWDAETWIVFFLIIVLPAYLLLKKDLNKQNNNNSENDIQKIKQSIEIEKLKQELDDLKAIKKGSDERKKLDKKDIKNFKVTG